MGTKISKKFLNGLPGFFLAVLFMLYAGLAGAQSLQVRADLDEGRLGNYLLGVHFVYNDEKDDLYKDQSFAKWARRAGVRVARYPGGSVIKYWDWKDPSGLQKEEDRWDENDHLRADPSEWMSLDEYLDFVKVSGVKPLIGVNLLSGVRYNKVDESVKRAAEQVRYVVSKGHKGAFYYLGNEDMGQMGGIEEAAKIFARHASEMKKVDPGAKLFWNDNTINPRRLARFLKIAGNYADGVEFHGKWPYGDGDINKSITVAEWQKQYPVYIEKRGSFSERAIELRRAARKLGYPNLMLANNEYGLAQFKSDRFIGFTRYQYSLVIVELLQDLFIGQFDMAALWSNVAARKSGGEDREKKRLIDTRNGNRLNPMHLGFELLSSAQDKRLAKIAGGGPSGYGFAAIGDGTIELFVLNKAPAATTSSAEVLGMRLPDQTGKQVSMVDTADHWGNLKEAPVAVSGNRIALNLPPMSYTKISLRTR